MAQGLSAFDKIKIFVTGFGVILGGIFFMIGPGSVREEITYHYEGGLALVVFGVAIMLALLFVRIKALLLAVVSGMVAALCAFIAYNSIFLSFEFFWTSVLALLFGFGSYFCFEAVVTGEDVSKI